MMLGRNTPSAELLGGFVERVETLRAEKKQLSEAESAVLAEAKAAGFVPGAIRAVIKIRATKPSQLEEAEAILDSYRHALGMAADTPLFRHVNLMKVDTASREQVIEALKTFTPQNGSIIVEAGGQPVRLTRLEDGSVQVTDWTPPKAQVRPEGATPTARPKEPAPDVDLDGAEALGAEAFKNDRPIIANPFPFGDARRMRWDLGWRKASGSDGMGGDD